MGKKSRVPEDKAAVVSSRLTEEVAGELDEYVAWLKSHEPGGNWTRSSAAMNLIVKGLRDWRSKGKL